mgnify:CR=1 FL=1
MNIAILLGMVVVGAFLGLVVWEVLLKKAGGTVVLDENSYLMKQWKKALADRYEQYRDPINICQLFHYVYGAKRIGKIIEDGIDAKDSDKPLVRYATRGVLILCIIADLAVIALVGVIIYSLFMPNNALSRLAGLSFSRLELAIGLAVILVIIALYLLIIHAATSKAFIAKFIVFWTKVCPPVVVRRNSTD